MPDKPQGILHIQHHARHGGTEKFARELAQYMPDKRHYMLTTQAREWLIEDLNPNLNHRYRFTADAAGTLLTSLCAWLSIDLIHIHHLIGDRERLLNAIPQTGTSYGITLHDHYLACPTIKLVNADHRYCHEQTDASICQPCLSRQTNLAHIKITDWRQQHHQLLANANFVTTPGEWTTRSYQAWFPQVSFTTIPHGATKTQTSTKAIRAFWLPDDTMPHIGILGAMSQAKGEQRLHRLIERSQQRELQLRWVLIGYTNHYQDGWQSPDYTLTIHGSYDTKQIKPLLDHYRIPWLFFPAIAPETFCYTLTDAWQAGRPVLVPSMGALQERVENYGGGWILDNGLDDDRVLDQLVAMSKPRFSTELAEQTKRACQYRPMPIQPAIEAISTLYKLAPAPQPTRIQTLSSEAFMIASKRANLPQHSQQDWEVQYPAFVRYRKMIQLLNGRTGRKLRHAMPTAIRRRLRHIILGT